MGQFRLLSGDSESTPLDPPEVGYGEYQIWGDAEIEAFLTVTGGNIPRAIAMGYSHLLVSANATEQIRTDDLSITSKEVAKWTALIDYWNSVADGEDIRAVDDFAEIYDTRGVNGPYRDRPEGSPPYWVWGNRGW